MITAALGGDLAKVDFEKHDIFGVEIPKSCPNVPAELLNPRNTWKNTSEYDAKANALALEFLHNFEKYADQVSPEVLAVGPKKS
jgi:phosphoenolpyruvate carboxykinase (ATP)